MPYIVPTNCDRTGPDAEAAAVAITPTALRGRLPLALLAALATSATALSAQQLRPLFGKVVDAQGAPLAGAEVHVLLPDVLDERHRALCHEVVQTDARGRFRTKLRPCTYHLIWAIGPEGASRTCSATRWCSTGSLLELRADLRAQDGTAKLTGLEPWQDLAPFRLRLAVDSVELPDVDLAVGADGTCALPPLPSCRLTCEVVDKDGRTLTTGSTSAPSSEVQVRVEPPQEIPLRAVDANGAPVAGARVRARITSGYSKNVRFGPKLPLRHLWRDLGETGEDGRLVARVAMRTNPFEKSGRQQLFLVAEKAGRQTTYSGFNDTGLTVHPFCDGQKVAREGLTELTFTMPPAEPAFGRVRVGGQRVFAGQELQLRLNAPVQRLNNSLRQEHLIFRVRTDGEGRFEIPQLRPPSQGIEVGISGDAAVAQLVTPELQRRTPLRPVALHGASNYTSGPLEIALDVLPVLNVQLLDATGGPARDVDLLFLSRKDGGARKCSPWTARATTDSAGRVSMRLEPGKWLVFARNTLEVAYVNVDLKSDDEQQLRMQPMQTMRGRVVDEEGKPVAGARLEMRSIEWRAGTTDQRDPGLSSICSHLAWNWIDSVRTDEDGAFVCPLLPLPGIIVEAQFKARDLASQEFVVDPTDEPLTISMKRQK